MRNIVLTRIDDRLIHGQVVTAWIKQYPINRILIIDDELSQNRLMQRIYKAAAPMGIEINKVILGGMGGKKRKKTFNRNISASDDEVACFGRIIEKGVDIFYQLVPNDKAVNIKQLL